MSAVSPLPATEAAGSGGSASFNVSWSGTDVGSGISTYTIYVSDNGGAFTAWQMSTFATSASFTGQLGHTYGFYSIATDNVGNVEAPKTAAEASTQVTAPAPVAPTVKVTPYSVTYDGKPHSATGTATGTGGVNLIADLNLTGTTHTNAGTYANDAWTFTDPTGNYTSVSGTVSDQIAKAPLTVTVNNANRAVGAANPAFTVTYSGFVNGDTAAVLTGSPAFSTTATSSSPAGTYPITVSQGTLAAVNYRFVFVNGTLSVVQAPTVVITTTAVVLGLHSAGYTATVTVANSGTGPATNVTLTSATLGSATGSPLPQTLGGTGTLAPGASHTFKVSFPGSAGADGAGVAEKYSGTYTGGSFSASVRSITLP
jgi:hypothetical protein